MSPSLPDLLGFVDFDGVWLDDRQRCRWALRGLDLTVHPRSLVALVADPNDGAAEAVLDLLAGRRRPTKGRVSIDGVDLVDLGAGDLQRAVVDLELRPAGERRLCLARSTVFALRPTPSTLAAADLVVVLEDGAEVGRGCLTPARAG